MTDPDKESRYNGVRRCRICGTDENITRHHLIPKRMVEHWRYQMFKHRIRPVHVGHRCNIVKLCVVHHTEIERGNLRSELRALLTPNELRYLEKTAGREWMDLNYPREEAA